MDRAKREELYERTYKDDRNAVRDILLGYESDYDVVDDLTNDVFLKAWEALDDWNHQSRFLTWVCGIARQKGVDHVRAQQADKRANETLEVYVETPLGSTPEPYYDRADLSQDLAAQQEAQDPALAVEAEDSIEYALDTMPHRVACVARLRAKGYSNQEVAAHLGVAEKTIRNLMTESHKYFRDNREFNTTNRVREREIVPRRYSTQRDLERAVDKRFEKRNAAFEKRKIREAHPHYTLAEWREVYSLETDDE